MAKTAVFLAALALSLPGIAAAQPSGGSDETFADFVETFRIDAISAGIDVNVYQREMATAERLPVVMERNDNQPEFSRPVWKYLESAVSDRRITDGKTNAALHQATLNDVEEKYGVDAEIVAAIWGLESAYGEILGNYDVVSALATLASEGRRQSYGRSQLIGALKIIQNGYAHREKLKGSWAGAMGMTQFIPTTYLAYAVDENNDGLRDLWADHQDVFASTANYLAKSGFIADQPWGFEVTLPEGFDYASASLGVRRTVATWDSLGVTPMAGRLADSADLNATASVIVPAGAEGPAFIVFQNFRAIMKYNNSTAYALGVGLLSDAIAGRQHTIIGAWPLGDRPLSRE